MRLVFKTSSALVCIAAGLLMSPPANADGYSVKDVYAPAVRPVTCYVKAIVTGEFITQSADMAGVKVDAFGTNGLGAGGQLGCDVSDGRFVVGAFADYVWLNASVNVSAGGLAVLNMPFSGEGSLGARVGVLTGPGALLYGLGAFTVAQPANGTMGGLAVSLQGPHGLALGGGIEVPVTANTKLSLEYRHTTWDTKSNAVFALTGDTVQNSVRAGLAYRF